MAEPELKAIQRAARARRLTVAEWVRQALRAARHREPVADVGKKLDIVHAASRYSFPAGEIDQMLAEIERGYAGGPRR